MISLYLLFPIQGRIVQMADRYDCLAITVFYNPPTHLTWRITKALNRAVITTYKVPLQTVGKGDVQQHLSNPDTMSILVSDTLVSRAEPPPFGWTYIILEQTYEYWSSCQSSKANRLTIASIGRSCNASIE